jgi:hypothetical protein
VQPKALAALTQLQALTLCHVQALDAPYEQLIGAVSHLTLLTQLEVRAEIIGLPWSPGQAAAFTALTASTNLCSLQFSGTFAQAGAQQANRGAHSWILFEPGQAYPRLHRIDLQRSFLSGLPLSEQQLQVMCSCCPALESLVFVLDPYASPAAFQHLLQLSELTHLEVQQQYNIYYPVGLSSAAAFGPAVSAATAAAMGVAAQLSGLKQLVLWGLTALSDPVLLQLTALRALEELTLHAVNDTVTASDMGGAYVLNRPTMKLMNKVRPCQK